MRHNSIQTKKLLKYLHCLLITKFEYSPLGKTFNRGLDKDDKREGLFKRLKNIKNRIKDENKQESEPIKNEEQSEVLKDESTVVDKKPKKLCC